MHEWHVTLTQRDNKWSGAWCAGRERMRHTAAVVNAIDATDAARRAQRTLPGWTAVLVERAG